MNSAATAASLRSHAIRGGSLSRPAFQRHGSEDYAIAAAAVGTLVFVFFWASESIAHWFLLPVAACGILAGVDVVRWLRGRLGLFDPRTIIACLAFYGFFVAPLLHVVWDRFGVGYDLLLFGDWRPWLGAMAALNAAGLIAYRIAHHWTFSRARQAATRWEIQEQTFYLVFGCALLLSAGGAAGYLWQMGGPLGVVESFESNQAAFMGTGWMLVLAWPLAVLSFIVLVTAWTDREKWMGHGLTTVILLLGIGGMGHFVLMGWYGSRSATIWALFWMAGIAHYRLRVLSPKVTASGLLLLVGFMYFYGFYKERGREGFEVLRSPSMWMEPKGYQRDLKALLLGDLARADGTAYILHNLVKEPGDYDYRWGLTYAGALSILIPKSIWRNRPEFKVDAGTEAQLGKTTALRSSRVYGLNGEALLNFGPGGVVPMFAIYGALLGWYRKKLASWDRLDARLLVAPFFAILFVAGLVGDSDNLVFAAMTEGFLVLMAVTAASKRLPAA